MTWGAGLRWVVLFALVAASACTNLGGLLLLPVDLVRWPYDAIAQRCCVTRSDDAGPVEASLLEQAHRQGLDALVADTADPEYDPKLWARECDAGVVERCDRVARLFVFSLHDPTWIAHWDKRCAEGDRASCRLRGDVATLDFLGENDPAIAAWPYARGCQEGVVVTCARAAAEIRDPGDGSGAVPAQKLEYWRLLDRGCALGDLGTCESLARCFGDDRSCGVSASPELSDYYAERARGAPIGRPRPPLADGSRRDRLMIDAGAIRPSVPPLPPLPKGDCPHDPNCRDPNRSY